MEMREVEQQLLATIVETLRPYNGSYAEKLYMLHDVVSYIIRTQKLKGNTAADDDLQKDLDSLRGIYA